MNRRALLHVAPILVVVALVLSAGSGRAAAPKRTPAQACRHAAHVKGAHVTLQSAQAIVFERGEAAPGYPRLYGCVLAIGKVRRLPDSEARYRLGGVWLASVYEGSAIGDESSKIGVLDLRTGKARSIKHLTSSEGAPEEIDNSGLISAFDVAPNGNLVWLVSAQLGTTDPALQLHAADGRPIAERVVDAGTIDPKSVKLAKDGRSVRYAKDGVTQSAMLR